MLFDELDITHQCHVGIIIISNCFETWEKLYPSYIYKSEREKMKWLQERPGWLKILIASMQLYLIMYITLYLFICMHFISIY